MQIKQVMTPSPEVISPEASLAEAATMMKRLDVGSLPVSNGDSIVGWITDRDITIRATAEHRNPDAAVVREAMSPAVVFCTENDDVGDCARLMEEKQIRRLPVLNAERRLVGIVALGDLAVNTDKKLAGEVLEKVSEPSRPNRQAGEGTILIDTMSELRQVADDLTAVGDYATAALVQKAIDQFRRWQFDE